MSCFLEKHKVNIPQLAIEKDDIIQFGDIYPSALIVNGKGDILSTLDGDNERIVDEIESNLKKHSFIKKPTIVNG